MYTYQGHVVVCANKRKCPCVIPPGCALPSPQAHGFSTIGPCSGNILLTFGGSCPCHLETKTNGLTSPPVACKTSTVQDICPSCWHFAHCETRIDALCGRKLIVWESYAFFLLVMINFSPKDHVLSRSCTSFGFVLFLKNMATYNQEMQRGIQRCVSRCLPELNQPTGNAASALQLHGWSE